MRCFMTCVSLLVIAGLADAGTLGGSTASPNNDDYVGSFEANPNPFNVSGFFFGSGPSPTPSVRVFSTLPSGGITEYAVAIGAGGLNFDNVYELQLGFDVGGTFVKASEIAPELRFDLPATASPAIGNLYKPHMGPYPLLEIVDHAIDTIRIQGSTNAGIFSQINFSDPAALRIPLDVPDLDRPFTLRLVQLYGGADVDGDRLTDRADVNLLTKKINEGVAEPAFDLDLNGAVNLDDRTTWVKKLLNTYFGDSNLDRQFNSSDLVKVFDAGLYETNSLATWDSGDWSGDGKFGSEDLVLAFQDGGYEQGRRSTPLPAAAAIPEPGALALCGLAALLLVTMARDGSKSHIIGRR